MGFPYDVLAFTEFNLTDSVNSSEIFPPGYHVHRLDRNINNSSKSSGGGVLIAVNHNLESEKIESPVSLEQLCVKIKKSNGFLYICCIYLPPDSNATKYITHINYIEHLADSLNERDSLIVCGDYNLPDLVWVKDDDSRILFPASVLKLCDE